MPRLELESVTAVLALLCAAIDGAFSLALSATLLSAAPPRALLIIIALISGESLAAGRADTHMQTVGSGELSARRAERSPGEAQAKPSDGACGGLAVAGRADATGVVRLGPAKKRSDRQ